MNTGLVHDEGGLRLRATVTVAYTDCSKAFDSVSHEKIFTCLYLYGSRGNLLKWIKNFFMGRMH